MRIVLLSAACSVHTRQWAVALTAKGHSVEVVSLPEHAAGPYDYPPEIPVRILGPLPGVAAGTAALRRLLRDSRPDILSAHTAVYGALAVRSGFFPMLLTVWGSGLPDAGEAKLRELRRLRRMVGDAYALSAVWPCVGRRLRKQYGARGPVYATPFGVDTALFRPIASRRPPAKDCLTIGMVKQLERETGTEVLLRAYALLRGRLMQAGAVPAGGMRLRLYGSGPETHPLMELAAALGLEDEVTFLGGVPHAHMPGMLSGMDFVCLPCVAESASYGTAPAEAMACGLPVIASDLPGFRETVENGRTGFLVPPGDAEMMADKMELLALTPRLCQAMGMAGRRMVKEKLDAAHSADALEAALLEAADPAFGRKVLALG